MYFSRQWRRVKYYRTYPITNIENTSHLLLFLQIILLASNTNCQPKQTQIKKVWKARSD